MKRIVNIISIILCFASAAFAEDSQGLSQQSMESIQQQTRELSAYGVSEAQAQKMLTQMVQNRFEKQNLIRARQVVADTAKAGLPTEAVMSKAMEGMAKQAKEEHIIAAMETVRNRYAHANQLAKSLSVDKQSQTTIAAAITDSMTAGMSAKDMDGLTHQLQLRTKNQQHTRNKATDDQLAIQTMQTVRTMARLGTRSADVAETLSQALQNQYTHREMYQLRQQIAQHAQNASPQQIANQHAGAIGKGPGSGNQGGTSGGGPGGGSNGGSSGGNGSGGSDSGGNGSGGSDSGGNGSGGSDSGGSGSGGSGSGGSGSGGSGSGGSGSGGSGSGGSGSGGSGSGGSGSK